MKSGTLMLGILLVLSAVGGLWLCDRVIYLFCFYGILAHLLTPPCLLQGSPVLSCRRLLFQQFGGAVHYSDHHRPVAPLAACPSDRLPVPCLNLTTALLAPLPTHPARIFPFLDKASFLEAPLLLTSRCDVCLGHLSSCFVCRRESWARRDLGMGPRSETGRLVCFRGRR